MKYFIYIQSINISLYIDAYIYLQRHYIGMLHPHIMNAKLGRLIHIVTDYNNNQESDKIR